MWFDDLAQAWQGKRVLVMGDLMLDVRSHYCTVRPCNEFDGPILKPVSTTYYPGGAAFTAMNCRELGAEVWLIGMAAPDEPGERLADLLCQAGVRCPWTQWEQRRLCNRTTVKTRVYCDGDPMYRLDDDWTNCVHMDRIEEFLWTGRQQFDALLISDYQKGIWSENLCINQVMDRFRACNPDAIVTANPKPALIKRTTGKVDLLQLNESEWQQTADWNLPTEYFLRTRGKEGLWMYHGNFVTLSKGRSEVEQPDVAGCGDATFAAATLALVAGGDCQTIAPVARAAGTAKARKFGTQPVSVDDIKKELNHG